MTVTSKSITLTEAIEHALGGRRVQLRCPAHDDSTPSLSVAPGDSQPVVLKCQANCSTEDILAAEGLTWADISNEKQERETESRWTPAGTATAIYPYTTADGTLLYEVVRALENGKKRFFQRQPDHEAKSGYKWNLDGVTRVLYRLPEVVKTVTNGGTIWVAEGEKCVHALLSVIPDGDAATCNSGGAGKFLPDHARVLAGANVIICADADEPGRDHAHMVREMLLENGCTVTILEAPPGRSSHGKPITDIADHVEAGRPLSSMVEVTPGSEAQRARTAVDLNQIVERPEWEFSFVIPNILAHGERLLLTGQEGGGKSQWMRQVAACVAGGIDPFWGTPIEPKRVLYIDAENHPGQTLGSWKILKSRIKNAGGGIDDGMMHVIEGWNTSVALDTPGGSRWLQERVRAYQPELLLLGPIYNMIEGSISSDETAGALARAVNAARAVSNCAVIMEHHAPLRQAGDRRRDLRPIGSSLLLRWPDFGYALDVTETEGVYEWKRFRGDRVRGRNWPDALRWGKGIEMPWVACVIDEDGNVIG